MKARETMLRSCSAAGAVIGYGCLLAFISLVGLQVYRWFRDGEWTHISVGDALHTELIRCCVKDADTGRIVTFIHWLESPAQWLGMHKILEAVPASLALFAVSIAGNCLFIYCRDRLERR